MKHFPWDPSSQKGPEGYKQLELNIILFVTRVYLYNVMLCNVLRKRACVITRTGRSAGWHMAHKNMFKMKKSGKTLEFQICLL